MRGLLPTGSLLLAFASGCWGGAQRAPTTPGEPVAEALSSGPGVTPSWAPALSPQQRALLTPLKRAIQTPAMRVFPDLSRFGYAPARPLRSPDDAIKFTKMVTQVLKDSPRFYSLGEAPPEAANMVTQYGPAGEAPDGFSVARRGEGEIVTLVAAPGADAARAAVSRSEKLAEGGDVAGAILALREGLTKSAGAPALRMALGSMLKKAGKASEAEAVFRELVAIDPTFAPAQIGLAEMAEQRGDLTTARRALAEGLAFHPASPRGLDLAKKIGAGGPGNGGWIDAGGPTPQGSGRVTPPKVFLDVDQAGAIHVATAATDAAQIYGGCRAIMRHEPDVREQLWKQPRETPYFLSMGEEVVCLEAAIGAYLAGKANGQPASHEMEALTDIAREEGLSGFVMFEILGQRRPERARTAPADVHRDVVAYVERHVLSATGKRPQATPDQPYTAAR